MELSPAPGLGEKVLGKASMPDGEEELPCTKEFFEEFLEPKGFVFVEN